MGWLHSRERERERARPWAEAVKWTIWAEEQKRKSIEDLCNTSYRSDARSGLKIEGSSFEACVLKVHIRRKPPRNTMEVNVELPHHHRTSVRNIFKQAISRSLIVVRRSLNSIQMLTLTDFIVSSKTRTCPVLRAKGVKVTKGGCLCGKIIYEFSDEPVRTVTLLPSTIPVLYPD